MSVDSGPLHRTIIPKYCQALAPNPNHPTTFEHEGRVPHKNYKSRKDSEWSSLHVWQKNSGGQQEEGHGVVHHVQGEHHQSSLDHYEMPIYKEYLNHTLGLTLSTPV